MRALSVPVWERTPVRQKEEEKKTEGGGCSLSPLSVRILLNDVQGRCKGVTSAPSTCEGYPPPPLPSQLLDTTPPTPPKKKKSQARPGKKKLRSGFPYFCAARART